MSFTLSAVIKLYNIDKISVDLDGWHCSDTTVERTLNQLYPVIFDSPSNPDPLGEIVHRAVNELGAMIIDQQYDKSQSKQVF